MKMLKTNPSPLATARLLANLATFLRGGIPLLKALEILEESTPSLKARLQFLKREIADGNSFTAAAEKADLAASADVSLILKTGEASGDLTPALEQAAQLLRERESARQRLRQALAYPIFVLTLSFFTVLFLILVILPTFTSIFREMEVPLPAFTLYLIRFADGLTYYRYPILLGIILSGLAIRPALRHPRVREAGEKLRLALPIIGPTYKKSQCAHLAINLGVLMKSGCPVIPALESVIGNAKSFLLKEELVRIKAELENGQKMAAALRMCKMFPAGFNCLVAVGEAAGNLENILFEIGRAYQKEVEESLNARLALVEPLATLTVGAVVAVIIAGMLLPLTSLINALKQY